ncbi:MAG: DUF1648 domain-containing protein [Eggerthellaceae bacterium]|nr:DUF1648 domain-containing protein [Eggerthellaceae bacterium]
MKTFQTVLAVILTFLPLAVGTAIIFYAMPETVPLHFNIAGEPDKWGDRIDNFAMLAIVTATNIILLLCIIFTKPAMDSGIVHGVSNPLIARYILLGALTFIDILIIATLIYQTNLAISYASLVAQ